MNEFLPFKKVKISKKNNKFRTIYIPSPEYKILLKALIPFFNKVYVENRVFDSDHAFLKGRNCVTNAKKHIKNNLVLCLDIENFFDSLKEILLLKYIPPHILNIVLIGKAIPQGFPTSPILSNIAMIDIDFKIIMTLRKINSDIIYSRYADDLTISFNSKSDLELIHHSIKKILDEYNLSLNADKYSLYDKNHGRAIITGIGVSKNNVHPTRKTLRKMRAAAHQQNLRSYLGLKEWSKCKHPKNSSQE